MADMHAAADDGQDELLVIHEDEVQDRTVAAEHPWRVLIVDDDRGVHEATVLALRHARVLGRPLSFLHAYSAAEALATVGATPDLDLMLLDVVMETEDAGLRLVERVREHRARRQLRIVVRTGQPGYAAEDRVRGNYEVDGYLLKAQMTGAMLLEALARALGARDGAGGS